MWIHVYLYFQNEIAILICLNYQFLYFVIIKLANTNDLKCVTDILSFNM